MSYIGKAKYLELNQNSTQSITSTTYTAVQFPNSVKNTFGTDITISGTGNTTFTNASGQDMYLIINSTVVPDSSSAASTAVWFGIVPNRVIGNNTMPANSASDGLFSNIFPFSVCSPLYLANGDSFQIQLAVNSNQTLGNSSSLYSKIYRTCLVVVQIPGI